MPLICMIFIFFRSFYDFMTLIRLFSLIHFASLSGFITHIANIARFAARTDIEHS